MHVTIEKEEGFGPYLYVLQWNHPRTGELMSSVFSNWADLDARRELLKNNSIETKWDLAVDYMRRAS